MATLVEAYKTSKNRDYIKQLRDFMVTNDYFSSKERMSICSR